MPDKPRLSAARAKERAQIVGWLREFGNHPQRPDCVRCDIADAIERGEPWEDIRG